MSIKRRIGVLEEERINALVEERVEREIEEVLELLEEKLSREEFIKVAGIMAREGEHGA